MVQRRGVPGRGGIGQKVKRQEYLPKGKRLAQLRLVTATAQNPAQEDTGAGWAEKGDKGKKKTATLDFMVQTPQHAS